MSSDESAQDNFYPRPPRGGRRHATGNHCKASRFLSTPSARRATCQPRPGSRPDQFLSTPSARRATRVYLKVCYAGRFLSTPSARRATDVLLRAAAHSSISIHALREEGDSTTETVISSISNFYPRPPRGGRPTTETVISSISNFYPRPPRGGRPPESDKIYVILSISIHALREEGDRLHQVPARHRVDFYPRPPRGGRPYQ